MDIEHPVVHVARQYLVNRKPSGFHLSYITLFRNPPNIDINYTN